MSSKLKRGSVDMCAYDRPDKRHNDTKYTNIYEKKSEYNIKEI